MSDVYPDREMEFEHDEAGASLPGWAVREMQRPVTSDRGARLRIMASIRAMPPHGAPRAGPAVGRRSWRARRGLAPLTSLAVAAVLGVMVAFGAVGSGASGLEADAWAGAGDMPRRAVQGGIDGRTLLTVVEAGPPTTTLGNGSADSLRTVLLRDTLRLVRFVLVAPAATRLALVGDFNGWDREATPMLAVAESTGMWEATVRLRPGAHRYAFVQDGTRWITGRVAGSVTMR